MEQSTSEQRLERARRETEASLENAQGGGTVSVGGERLPVRPFAAIAVFIAAFLVVELLTWTVIGGGIGLALGAVLGLLAGAFAAKLFVDRAAGDS